MTQSWKDTLNNGLAWLLGVIIVITVGFVVNDRLALGKEVSDNSKAIVRFEERSRGVDDKLANMDSFLKRIDSKLDKIADCQSKMAQDRDCD